MLCIKLDIIIFIGYNVITGYSCSLLNFKKYGYCFYVWRFKRKISPILGFHLLRVNLQCVANKNKKTGQLVLLNLQF